MESSRIFVKGLPPSISEADFKAHFTSKFPITDAKLIQHRRIGYIGFKSPEDATKAVKYFNKTFIRMSRIGVEIARPISDSSLPISRKAQREQDRENAKIYQKRKEERDSASKEKLNAATKRKRSDVDENDPKLKEFLEVMQPASKSKKWATEMAVEESSEPPAKIQAIEVPAAESDDEYESVPKITKRKKTSPAPIAIPTTAVETNLNTDKDEPMPDAAPIINATDDDWLRSRTNRLLDLVDPEDITIRQSPAPTDIDKVEVVEHTSQEEESPVDEEQPSAEPVPEEEAEDTADTPDPTVEAILAAKGRLYIRNLSYTVTEDEIRSHFEPYGSLEEVHLPVDSSGKGKGFAFVLFESPQAAAEAFHNLDGEPFQGRLLHILPGQAKRENKLDEYAISQLPLHKQKLIKQKQKASTSTFNWNSLFMSQDAVNSSVAARLGVSKSELIDPFSTDAGVTQAKAETAVIQDSKEYFKNNGVDLDAFKRKERGDTAMLVKNFSHSTGAEELRKMFEEYGQVVRFLMPPTGTIAIVEFSQPTHARAAYAGLAYRRMESSILYLEKAPKDLFTTVSTNVGVVPSDRNTTAADPKLSRSDLLEGESPAEELDTATLFVRNLNFSTTSNLLTETFKPLDGFMSARVNTKTDPKKPGQVLSMGFGFLEFKSKAQAQAALKAMDGHMLEGHRLLIKASHKGADAAEERRKEDRSKKLAGKRTKIIIKNLPFEATKKEVRDLLSSYGQLRTVRVPKKIDHSARGFAFAEFITAREAENALEALKDTHLLGRRLVLEFASGDTLDAEEEIERMQKKTSGQVNKVALQKLTGGGRKKFNIEGNDGEED